MGFRNEVRNEELDQIREKLSSLYNADELDAFGLYLYGIVLRETGDPTLSTQNSLMHKEVSQKHIKVTKSYTVLLASVTKFAWNWSAWMDLATTLTSESTLDHALASLPDGITKFFFEAHASAHLSLKARSLSVFAKLESQYPTNIWVLRAYACALVQFGEFSKSQFFFEKLRLRDPFDFDGMDAYAQALQETTRIQPLTTLAMDASTTAKWTAQNCLIVARFHYCQGSYLLTSQMATYAAILDPGLSSAFDVMALPVSSSMHLPSRIAFLQNSKLLQPNNAQLSAQIGAAYVFRAPAHAYYYLKLSTKTRQDDENKRQNNDNRVGRENVSNIKSAEERSIGEFLQRQDWSLISFALESTSDIKESGISSKQLAAEIRHLINPATGLIEDKIAEKKISDKLTAYLRRSALLTYSSIDQFMQTRNKEATIYREDEAVQNEELENSDLDSSIHTPVRRVRRPHPEEGERDIDEDDIMSPMDDDIVSPAGEQEMEEEEEEGVAQGVSVVAQQLQWGVESVEEYSQTYYSGEEESEDQEY